MRTRKKGTKKIERRIDFGGIISLDFPSLRDQWAQRAGLPALQLFLISRYLYCIPGATEQKQSILYFHYANPARVTICSLPVSNTSSTGTLCINVYTISIRVEDSFELFWDTSATLE